MAPGWTGRRRGGELGGGPHGGCCCNPGVAVEAETAPEEDPSVLEEPCVRGDVAVSRPAGRAGRRSQHIDLSVTAPRQVLRPESCLAWAVLGVSSAISEPSWAVVWKHVRIWYTLTTAIQRAFPTYQPLLLFLSPSAPFPPLFLFLFCSLIFPSLFCACEFRGAVLVSHTASQDHIQALPSMARACNGLGTDGVRRGAGCRGRRFAGLPDSVQE